MLALLVVQVEPWWEAAGSAACEHRFSATLAGILGAVGRFVRLDDSILEAAVVVARLVDEKILGFAAGFLTGFGTGICRCLDLHFHGNPDFDTTCRQELSLTPRYATVPVVLSLLAWMNSILCHAALSLTVHENMWDHRRRTRTRSFRSIVG